MQPDLLLHPQRDLLIEALGSAMAATFDESKLTTLGYTTGTKDYLTNHERLLRSMKFGDDDLGRNLIDYLEVLLHRTPTSLELLMDNPSLERWIRRHRPTVYEEFFEDPTDTEHQPETATSTPAIAHRDRPITLPRSLAQPVRAAHPDAPQVTPRAPQPAHTAVIITALAVESQAVLQHLESLYEVVHTLGTIYRVGTFANGDQPWKVAVAEIGAGNVETGIETARAIAQFDPQVVLFVGVAGGLKDLAKGDVVAATKVYAYHAGKADADFHTRPDVGRSAHDLVQRARAEASKSDWLARINNSDCNGSPPSVVVKPIAAGEQVVTSTASNTARLIRHHYNDAVAVEMEGYGFLAAAFAHKAVSALVVRGISDLIDDKNSADGSAAQHDQRFQAIASSHASAFAFQILSKLNGHGASSSNTRDAPRSKEPARDTQAPVSTYAAVGLDVSDALNAMQKRLEAVHTGGDSFCYWMLYDFDLDAATASQFALIKRGEFALHDVRLRIRDMTLSRDVWERPWGEINAPADYTLLKWKLLPDVYYRVFFFARNGAWNQDLILKRSDRVGCWLAATRVLGRNGRDEILRHLDNDYEAEFGVPQWRE